MPDGCIGDSLVPPGTRAAPRYPGGPRTATGETGSREHRCCSLTTNRRTNINTANDKTDKMLDTAEIAWAEQQSLSSTTSVSFEASVLNQQRCFRKEASVSPSPEFLTRVRRVLEGVGESPKTLHAGEAGRHLEEAVATLASGCERGKQLLSWAECLKGLCFLADIYDKFLVTIIGVSLLLRVIF